MADAVKELLAKFTLDTSEFSPAVKSAQKAIADAAKADEVRNAASIKATQQAITLLQKEVTLTQQVTTATAASTGATKAQTAELSKQQSIQQTAAQSALSAINQQIAAEKLKEAAAKAATAEQRRSAAEAIAIAKNAMAQQKQIALDAAAATKAAFADAAKAKASASKIPIVSAVQPRQELPERPGTVVDQRANRTQVPLDATASTAAQTAANTKAIESEEAVAVATVTAEGEITEAVSASTLAYQKLAVAIQELKIAQTNQAETMAAIRKGTLDEDAATNRLAIDLERLIAAKLQVSEASYMTANIGEIEEYQKEVAALREKTSVDQALRDEDLLSFKAYVREKKALQDEETASSYGSSSSGTRSKEARGVYLSPRQAVSGDLRAFSGRGSYRAAENFVAMIPGAAQLATAVFPIAGAAALVSMLGQGISALAEFAKKLQQLPSEINRAFDSANLAVQKSTDEINKSADTTQKAIDKLLHRSQAKDDLALSIDNAKIAADELAESADRAYESTAKLLDQNKMGGLASLFQKFINNVQQTPWSNAGTAPSDSTNNISGTIKSFRQQLQDAANLVQQATQNGTATSIDAKGVEHTYDLKAAQKNYDDLHKNFRTKMQDTITQTSSYTYKGPGDTEPIPTTKEDAIVKAHYGYEVKTPEQNRVENANNLALAAKELNSLSSEEASVAAKNRQAGIQETQKQIEERQQAYRDELAAAQAHYASLKELASNDLEQNKLDIQKESDDLEQAYKSGYLSAEDYYNKKKELSKATLQATLDNIETERAADIYALQDKAKGDPTLKGQKYNDELLKINAASDLKSNQARYTYTSSVNQDDVAAGAANSQQVLAQIKTISDAKLKAIALEMDANKEALANQNEDAEQYLQNSLSLIQQELDAKKAAAQASIAIVGSNSSKALEYQRSIVDATAAGLDAIQKLNASSPEVQLQYENSRYSAQSSLLGAQASAMQAPGSSASLSDLENNNASQRLNLVQHIASLSTIQDNLDKTDAKWKTIQTDIVQASIDLANLNKQHEQMSDNAAKLGGALGAGTSGVSGIFTSRYARGLESSLQGGASTAQNSKGYVDAFNNSGNIFGRSLSDGIDAFAKKVTAAAGALGSFVQTIANAGSASAGGIGGGIAGAGLGQSLGSAAGGPNGPLSSLGAAAGPLGALAGGMIGSTLGAIFGQKQEEVQDDINQLNASYKAVMASMSSGNTGLNSTIQSLQGLIAQAQEEMAQTKKGGSQYKDLIQQYNDQIVALENQQEQQMAQLTNSLTTLGAASPYQDMLSSIQSILQQYSQFASAATSATQLAQANQFLTSSLQQLGVTYSQQLLQDETTQVQNAIQLNQLYNQRNQLTQQFLQQTEAIAGQGTLTRGITQSQSKFSQLYNLDVNYNQQMLQLNAQIATAQYQVSAAQQIFNLQTTAQGLETQLVALQEQGINQDMARIAAMANLLGVMQSTGYSITNLSGVNSNDPNATVTLLLQLLVGLLSNGSTASTIAGSNGSSLLAQILGSSYANQSGLGYGGYTGTGIKV